VASYPAGELVSLGGCKQSKDRRQACASPEEIQLDIVEVAECEHRVWGVAEDQELAVALALGLSHDVPRRKVASSTSRLVARPL
jgi:hypothetical protein